MTAGMLENARKRLRALIKLIEKRKRDPIYTNFEDELGESAPVNLPGFTQPADHTRFLDKARAFLRKHQDEPAIAKLRSNQPLTGADIKDLEKILTESGAGSREDLDRATSDAAGLPQFVRSVVGLDREAANRALAGFMQGSTMTANQIEFLKLVVDHLVEHGMVEPVKLYESPFTDISPLGPNGLFDSRQLNELVAAINHANTVSIARV